MRSVWCKSVDLDNLKVTATSYWHQARIKKQIKCVELGNELGFTGSVLKNMWDEKRREQMKVVSSYKQSPKRERKDNKDVINHGSSGSSRNPVRYPSKKRNLYTWRNFYKLFPSLAEKDNFDGKTSDRMK